MTTPVDEKLVRLVREPMKAANVTPIDRNRGRAVPSIDAVEMAKPLPPIPYLVEGLKMSAGPPTCFAGYGYSRKTLALQDLALSVASGKRLWGIYRVKKGRALHIDYEQGERLTRERYQRLARGKGFALEELGDRLHLSTYPDTYLDGERGSDDFERSAEGFDVVILDSFRAACPSADENKSDVRKHIDKLARISERTGALFAIILHARKEGPPMQGKLPMVQSSAKFSLRGSSSLYDALAGVFVLSGTKGKPSEVKHEKERNTGLCVEDFGLDTEDMEKDGDARWGLRMRHLNKEEMDTANRERPQEELLKEHQQRIIDFLSKKRTRGFRGTKETFRDALQMGKVQFQAAVEVLLADGKLDHTNATFSLPVK